jgi:CheY-like chemotaxis protein
MLVTVPTTSRSPDTEPRLARVILLVEDSAAQVQMTQRALRESSPTVALIVMRDGQEAVDYLLRLGSHAADRNWRRPDLVLLDLHLPRLSGREVLERIRLTPSCRHLPVVVLSSSRHPDDVLTMYSAGANSYVEKPQDYTRFAEVLRNLQHFWLETALLPE